MKKNTRKLRGIYEETTRNLRGNQRLKRDFWRFLRRKKRGNPRKKRHFSIHGNTDQSFQAFRKLLSESRENLNSHFLIQKLWRRFWRTVEDYSNKINFLDILTNTLV